MAHRDRPAPRPVAVVLHPAGPRDALARALAAVHAHTPAGVAVLVAGDDPAREDPAAWLAGLALDRDVRVLDAPGGAGAAWTAAAAAVPDADLALVHLDTEVGPGWLDGLGEALDADDTLASATALASHGALLSVPRRNGPWALLGVDTDVPHAARAVAAAARAAGQAAARIPCPLPHAALVSRPALQATGGFDAMLEDPVDALADLGARAAAIGLRHAAAHAVVVGHRGGAYRAEPVEGVPALSAAVLARHPALAPALADAAQDRWSALARALAVATGALRGRSVTVDARALTGELTGTKLMVAELVRALARRDGLRLRIVVPDRPSAAVRELLAELGDVELLPAAEVAEGIARSDVVHRPWGVDGPGELAELDLLGERLVLTQHDLIGFRMASAFPDADAWLSHRRTTAAALGAAAMVLAPSAHAVADVEADDLVAPSRLRVVPNGTRSTRPPPEPVRPRGLDPAVADGFLVCLGQDLPHKQLVFALELLAALDARHGWAGALVLAGAEAPVGSSAGREAAWALEHPALAGRVHRLPAVDEAAKAWLYAHAAAVACPSTVEGFGLVPFEAAAVGTPCLCAPVASLGELLTDELALLVAWDAAASADRAMAVLAPGEARDALVAGVREAGRPLTWDAAAAAAADAYEAAVALPAPAGARVARRADEVEAAYWRQRDALDEAANALVGPDALLDAAQRRRLVALASDPRGRRVLDGALKAAGRLRRSPFG